MKFLKGSIFIILMFFTIVNAQHRGDNIRFQGLQSENYLGVVPSALGGAYTAQSGDLNSLFWNPAGLSRIKDIELDFGFNSATNKWRESQRYRPNRIEATLPFYLQGWYVPKPENNGEWDYILAADSSYIVNSSISGNDPYSEEDADWKRKNSTSGFSHFSVAYPLQIMDRDIVLAGSYSSNVNVQDFDRNDTYLSPHIGYTAYDGLLERVDGSDTLNVDWYKYLRSRSGTTISYRGAVALQPVENLNVGLSVDIFTGETDDVLKLDKVGKFGLFDENEFFFSYDTLNTAITGSSDFNATKFNLGFIYNLNNVDVALNVQLPYTLERKWRYTKSITDTSGIASSSISGTDNIEFPAIYTFALNIRPVEKLSVSFDFEYAPYKNGKFNYDSPDSLDTEWTNQNILRFGIKYKLNELLTIMGGYRYTPQVFIPDGSANDDKGPTAISYSFGASINILENIQLNAAYVMQELRYYDQYFSNTNYVTESVDRLLLGINYKFK